MKLVIGMTVLTCISLLINLGFSEAISRHRFFKDTDLSYSGFVKALSLATFCLTLGSYLTLYELYEFKNQETYAQSVTSEVSTTVAVGKKAYRDGLYSGKGQGFNGPMTVEVQVVDGFISRIEVLSHTDDLAWYERAIAIIPDQIIDHQKVDVDVVTGATYSSLGIIDGVKDALSQSEDQ